jgi:hypothetical protein
MSTPRRKPEVAVFSRSDCTGRDLRRRLGQTASARGYSDRRSIAKPVSPAFPLRVDLRQCCGVDTPDGCVEVTTVCATSSVAEAAAAFMLQDRGNDGLRDVVGRGVLPAAFVLQKERGRGRTGSLSYCVPAANACHAPSLRLQFGSPLAISFDCS